MQKKYFQIIVEDHHLSHPSDIKSKDLSHETPIEIVYLRNLYSILPVTYIVRKKNKRKKWRDLIKFVLDCASDDVAWHTGVRVDYCKANLRKKIKDGIKNVQWNWSSINNVETSCSDQMKELKEGLEKVDDMPDAQLVWLAENEPTRAPVSQLRVKKMFEELSDKYEDMDKDEQPLQYAKHKESEGNNPRKHDSDKLILSQAGRMSCVLPLKSEIYITSNDTGFFSPHKGDSTITNAIYIEFGITCANPKRIRRIVFPNSNDEA